MNNPESHRLPKPPRSPVDRAGTGVFPLAGIRHHLCFGLGALLLPGLFCLAPARAAQGAGPHKAMSLQVGFTQYTFSNVNRNDAEAAFKVLVRTIAQKRGYAITATTRIFEDVSDFEPEIKAGKLDLVIVDGWRFLAMDIRSVVTPCFTTAEGGKAGKRYVILTRRDSQLDTVEDLRGREITEFRVANANLGHFWLEALLRADHLGTPETFFSGLVIVQKPSAAVLPVFFGNKPACLVDEPGFNVMKELNPQVGARLQVVTNSESLADGLICLRNTGWPSEEQKGDIIRALAELHTDPAGQQILTLFKIGQLLPFKAAHLDTVARLRALHQQELPRAPGQPTNAMETAAALRGSEAGPHPP